MEGRGESDRQKDSVQGKKEGEKGKMIVRE